MYRASANLWALALVNNDAKALLYAQYSASSPLFPLNFVINLDVCHVFFFIFRALRCLGFSNSNRFNCCLSPSRRRLPLKSFTLIDSVIPAASLTFQSSRWKQQSHVRNLKMKIKGAEIKCLSW